MVIGDQHPHPQRPGDLDTLQAGDAIVNGQEDIGLPLGGQGDDFRRQAVPVLETIRYQVTRSLQPQGPKSAHSQGAGRCAVGIIIADDHQGLTLLDGLDEAKSHGLYA